MAVNAAGSLPKTQGLESVFEAQKKTVLVVPDIIEFVLSDNYLNRKNLYPRQATLLKIMFLQDEIFTSYDYDVIGEWENSFRSSGNNGVVPGLLERIQIAKGQGRKWFRQTEAVLGRRGGKGYIGGLGGGYVLWNYMAKGNPQEFYGIDRDKRMTFLVFGGKKEQAKAEQWRDLVNVINSDQETCFSPFISESLSERLTVYSPHDLEKLKDRDRLGKKSELDLATFIIIPKESTLLSGRGPASFAQVYDEMAHVTKSNGGVSAEDVYEAATPSLDQFKNDAWIYVPSSPWQMTGKFYDIYKQAKEMDEETGKPAYPETFMVQLASWDIYKDWEIAHKLPLITRRKATSFYPMKQAMQEYDLQMQQLERASPDTFKVERRSHFATVLDAYLNPDRVDEMFQEFRGEPLGMKTQGQLNQFYVMHGDPSKSGANFGLAIAHLVPPLPDDEFKVDHVVFDYLHAWHPSDFEENDYEIDYVTVEDEIKDYIKAFYPSEVSFDQFGSALISRLKRWARETRFPKSVQVFERTATAKQNYLVAETFKTALGLHLVHAPYFELAEKELKFLQEKTPGKVDKPDEGPIQTKDVADCIMICTWALIGSQVASFMGKDLAGLTVRGSQQGGMEPFPSMRPQEERSTDPIHQQLGKFGRPASSGGFSRPGPRGRGAGAYSRSRG